METPADGWIGWDDGVHFLGVGAGSPIDSGSQIGQYTTVNLPKQPLFQHD